MSGAWTSGPWHVFYDGMRGYVMFNEDGRQFPVTSYGMRELDANLRLMSAAPDLYEALEAMEAEKADYMRINNLGDAANEHTNKMARAALAKARGE